VAVVPEFSDRFLHLIDPFWYVKDMRHPLREYKY
jgi:hypothetical protein